MGLKSRREAVDYRAGGLQCGGHLVPLAGEPNVFPLCPSTIHVLRDGQHPSSLHRVLRPSVQVAFTYARPVSLGVKRRSWDCASPSIATTARHPDPRTPDVCAGDGELDKVAMTSRWVAAERAMESARSD